MDSGATARNFGINRRDFLIATAAVINTPGLALAQEPESPQASSAAAPKKAQVISSVTLRSLKGPIEEKFATAAHAGIQSVELGEEYTSWSDADVNRYKRLAQSYGLTMDALVAQKTDDGIAWAKRLEVPQIITRIAGLEEAKKAADLASAAGLKLVLDAFRSTHYSGTRVWTYTQPLLSLLKQTGSPYLRLLFPVSKEEWRNTSFAARIAEAIPYVAIFRVEDANSGQWDNIYRAIAKANFSGYIAFDYPPAVNEVENLMSAVTAMRKALNSVKPPPASQSGSSQP